MTNKIIFDQYSRYKICADVLLKQGIHDGTILDVGSGEECLLEQFLPNFDITYLDPLLKNDVSQKKIYGDIFSAKFSKKFDYVICIDTLEHIPKNKREHFLKLVSDLAIKGIMIIGPCSDKGDAIETDNWVNQSYLSSFGTDYKWLEEHFENELPELSFIENELHTLGWKTSVTENGHTLWLREFLPFVVKSMEFEHGLEKIFELSDYFNKNLYKYDHQSPCYRQVVIAGKDQPKITFNKPLTDDEKSESEKLWKPLKQKIDNGFVDLLQENKKIIQNLEVNLSNSMKHIEEKQKEIEDILEIKHKEIQDLQKAIESYQKIIIDIHQSFILRALHKYDKTIGKYLPLRPKKYAQSSNDFLPEKEQQLNLNESLKFDNTKKDILCFPIINWDFRIQRPQHLMSKFAKHGHRVFYFTVNLRKLPRTYEIKKIGKNLYQVELNFSKFFDIYKDSFDSNLIDKFMTSFNDFRKDVSLDAISIINFPTWAPVALEMKKRFGYGILFDCLDDFTGFANVRKIREKEEELLLKNSDLVTATSSNILKKIMSKTSKSLFLPNAGEFEHFNQKHDENILKNYKKPVIGYFGAISDWFDNNLIEFVAKKRPDYTFVLIGHTYGSNIQKLEKLPNVHFLGERPYSELPKYLHGFDVCLIPFTNTPLIEATHPVKIYEYLSTGKPVVCNTMKELLLIQDLCYLANSNEEFLQMIDTALKENSPDLIKKRIDYASKNTWNHRFEKLISKLSTIETLNLNQHN